jgi:hypothetical protein
MSAGITLCKARCPKYDAFTCILQIGSVDLMLEGIEGGLGVRVNRVSPELVSLSAG